MHEGLGRLDLPVAYSQVERKHRGQVRFPDGAQKRHVSRIDVIDEHPVPTLGGECAPQPVAQFELLAVLGELHIRRKRRLVRVVREHGIEVLVHDPFQAASVARRRVDLATRQQDSAEQSNSNAANRTDLLIH